MKAIFIKLFVPFILIIVGYFDKNNLLESSYSRAGYVILITLLGNFICDNYNRLGFYFKTKIWYREQEIRLSISYLFRIKVDEKFLLVKSRTRSYFQPVGGCYKTLPGSRKIFEKLGIRPDRKFETEKGIAKNDLRIYVKGKNVIDFFKWYDSKEDRETSPWREFCEELLTTEILPGREFRYIDYEFKKTIKTPILDLDMGGKGMFMYEVFDLVINDEQMPILREMQEQQDSNDRYIWVTDEIIQHLGHDGGSKGYKFEISPHTKYAQNLKYDR
ncbi:SMODS-associated NUDIX domain-containing protein [Elizabethkingia anophelis]|uniref:SMODS-associated NUDIX domain-containing protein n=1 Tax=Elizabethkingia anophelis TaxID=1117645 RepID=UPI0038917CBC